MDQDTCTTIGSDDVFAVGQTWHAVVEDRRIELITHNAEGAPLIGYQGEHHTGLVTKDEFAEWVRDEAAKQSLGAVWDL